MPMQVMYFIKFKTHKPLWTTANSTHSHLAIEFISDDLPNTKARPLSLLLFMIFQTCRLIQLPRLHIAFKMVNECVTP